MPSREAYHKYCTERVKVWTILHISDGDVEPGGELQVLHGEVSRLARVGCIACIGYRVRRSVAYPASMSHVLQIVYSILHIHTPSCHDRYSCKTIGTTTTTNSCKTLPLPPATRSCLTFLECSWTLWTPPGTAASPFGSSGSSRGLLGELSFSLCSECSRSSSDAFHSFFGLFTTSSTFHDAADTSASSSRSSSSTQGLPGEYFGLLCFELSLTRSDMFRSLVGRFKSSLLRSGAPGMSIPSPVSPSPWFADPIHSPSSSALGGLFGQFAALLGGFGGSGNSVFTYVIRSGH